MTLTGRVREGIGAKGERGYLTGLVGREARRVQAALEALDDLDSVYRAARALADAETSSQHFARLQDLIVTVRRVEGNQW